MKQGKAGEHHEEVGLLDSGVEDDNVAEDPPTRTASLRGDFRGRRDARRRLEDYLDDKRLRERIYDQLCGDDSLEDLK